MLSVQVAPRPNLLLSGDDNVVRLDMLSILSYGSQGNVGRAMVSLNTGVRDFRRLIISFQHHASAVPYLTD